MQRKRESWRFLCERHGEADVALLQEACTPPEEVDAQLDAGPGPWAPAGWSGAVAVVGVSGAVGLERVPVDDVVDVAQADAASAHLGRLAAAIVTLPDGERISLVSLEATGVAIERVPGMVREAQRRCGDDLPCIVGGDVNVWWHSDTPIFGDMIRMGLPLVGPHAPTYYNPMLRQTPMDAELQLDYVFASRSIAHRITVRALNDPDDWGPSDHCRIVVDLAEAGGAA